MSTLAERPIEHRRDCDRPLPMLGKLICANGAIQVRYWCATCHGSSTNYGKAELRAARINIDAVCTVDDYREDALPPEPCKVCGSTERVEHHHFAPQALQPFFRQSVWNWPVLPLCGECHDEWHKAVTPELRLTRVTLAELQAKRSTTLRELMDAARRKLMGDAA